MSADRVGGRRRSVGVGPVVVLTGASSGIGAALASAWAGQGARLVLSGRNQVGLARVARDVVAAGGHATVVAGDVTERAHREELVQRATLEHGRLDVLVNNAGRGFYASVAGAALEDVEGLLALNVVAPLHLTQLALPALRESCGTVVMMSSVAGVAAAPRMGAYAASKFALEALAMSLRAELAAEATRGRRPVRVLVVRPGPVDTPFRDNAVTDRRGGERAKEPGVRPRGARVQSPAAIAAMTLRAVDRGDAVVETSLFVRVASLASRVAPAIFRRVSASMARER